MINVLPILFKGDDHMPTLANTNIGMPIFRDLHLDVSKETDANVEIPMIEGDSGGFNKEYEDNFVSLAMAAKTYKYKEGYQWNTKNKSFIQLHKDLKSLGIKNNKFFLRLYDQSLKDVDPYAIVLPVEVQARIFRECLINPWYFLREICRIPVDGKPICPGGGSPFKIDRNSAACWLLFLNGIDHFASKPRQQGKTQNAIAQIIYAYHFGALGSNIIFGNKDFSLNKMNLVRFKAQRDMLPLYLQMRTSVDYTTMKVDKGTENVLKMKNPVTNNSITLVPTPSTEAKADGVGRGYTAPIQFWDEFEWMPYNTKVIYTAAPAYRKAAMVAKENQSLYGRIFTSTPGNLDSRDGQTAEVFIHGNDTAKGMLIWNDSMFDTPMSQIKKIVNSASYNGVVFVEHSWKQLKCTMEWYEKSCQDVGYDSEQIAREILLQRLRGTSKSPFRRTDIMNLLNGLFPPIDNIDLSDNCSPIYFYEKMNRKIPYLIGIDTAEGLSGDNTAMIVINPVTKKIAAEFKSPYIRQDRMGKLVVNFMTRFCPKGLLIIENNRGRELIHTIQNSMFSANLWYDIDKFGDKEKMNQKDYDTSAERALGFATTPKTRPILMNTLETMVSEETDKINGKFVVDDICSLEKSATGKIAAASGKHDDCIMAYLIAMTVFLQATNLDEWGIYRGMTAPKDISTPEDKAKRIKELLSLMPKEIRDFFNFQDKDPVTEAFKYGQQLQQVKLNQEMHDVTNRSNGGNFWDDLDDTPSVYNTPAYSQDDYDDAFADRILSMNNYVDEKTSNFDIDDFYS